MSNNENELYQNLLDAYCSKELANECYDLAEKGQILILLKKLGTQREELLNDIHNRQKALSNLDYLIFQIRKGDLHYV